MSGTPEWLRSIASDGGLPVFGRITELDLNERTDGHKEPTPKPLSDRVTDDWLKRLAGQDKLERLEGAPWIADDRKVVLPPREELHTSMESLIHHFKIVTEGFRVPAGEVYTAIESPRGELGCYIVSDGTSRPYRVHVRTPSFANLQALAPMARGALIADAIAIVSTVDPVLGDVDR